MSSRFVRRSIFLCVLLKFVCAEASAQNLQADFGASGLQALSYGGVVLESVGSHPEDAFHIWHMKATDLSGNVLQSGQYGWGESNDGRTWDAQTLTWTYRFDWGTIQVQYLPHGNTLDLLVTETNNLNSGIVFEGATIYPFALHFPSQPAFSAGNTLSDNTSAPSVMIADYGSGQVTAVVADATKPMYSGYEPANLPNTYEGLISSTSPDSLATFLPHADRPVRPGESDTFLVSFRFAPSGTPAQTVASDAYQSWAAVYPPALHWKDRRVIGTVFLASSPDGPASQPGGYPNNPRRYFSDSTGSDFDVSTPQGIAQFQARILQQAQTNVENLTKLNAQGAITWDLEGEQYPQSTSYVCSPDQIAAVAPEMESVITDSSSPYKGMKLDDAYFHIMLSAGFRIGVCVRPQHFKLNADGSAEQDYLSDDQVAAQLVRKMKYAHDRWGATIFYVDSSVDPNGGTLDGSIFQQVQAALPDSLIIPEETTAKHFAYTAPFATFIFHTDLGTPEVVHNFYPEAFSANLINDVDPAKLAQYQTQLTDSVRRGDILMVHADYWQQNNPTVVAIYEAAGVTAPPPTPPPTPAPAPVAPVITWTTPAAMSYGTPLSSEQLNAAANVPGKFMYTPAGGTVLSAGTSMLSVVFTPEDTSKYSVAQQCVPLDVTKADPPLAWPLPSPIAYGMVLSSTQLSATSPVPATMEYTPKAGALLQAGNQKLEVIMRPNDSNNYNARSVTVDLQVTKANPTLFLSADLNNGDAILTATFDSAEGVPTGTVVFSFANGASVSASLSGSGVASIQAPKSFSGTVAANYLGDTNFNTAAAKPISITTGTPDFTLNATTTSLTVPSGDSTATTLSVQYVFGFSGTVALSCSGLPVNATCDFSPTALSGSSSTSTLVINSRLTNVAGSNLRSRYEFLGTLAALIYLPFLRRANRVKIFRAVAAVAIVLFSSGLVGCGSSNPDALTMTPAGTYVISVNAAASDSIHHSVALTLQVRD